MTTRLSPDEQQSAPSRSEIENALSGRTKRTTRKAKRPEKNTFDLSAPPRRQQVIGGKLSGVNKRNKFSVFSRYSDISVANWIALAVVALIMAAFFWPNAKDSIREIDAPEELIQAHIGETDLTQSEQADLLDAENDNSDLKFSRHTDLDRANDFRNQEDQDSQIRSLLDNAKRQIAKGDYLTPVSNNAVRSYKDILLINPTNVAANQGLEFIQSRFLDIGIMELEKNDLKKAESILTKIGSVNAQSDEYEALSNSISRWKTLSKIDSFNTLGKSALRSGDLILPAKKNALYYYQQALELDQTNEAAILGLESITNTFVGQANQAIIGGHYQAASAQLATISIINPEHKSIKSLQTALERALLIETRPIVNNEPSTVIDSQDLDSSTPAMPLPRSNRTPIQQTLEQQTFDRQYLKQGLESYYKGEYEKAASLLQPLADKGIARAQFRLAYMHYLGRGFTQDTTLADSMIRAALPAIQTFADDNRAWAQSDLGSLYEDGLVLARDFKKAVVWYRSAAEQGYPGAQTNLGIMYARGRGVSTNRKTAIEWFLKAAKQGDNAAKRNLAAMGVSEN